MRERSERPVALPGSSGDVIARGGGTRWLWLIVLIAAGAVKAEAYRSVVHHRGGMIALLAVGLLVAVRRAKLKLVAIAAFSAAILAFALALHPAVAGAGLGFGAFALLLALFFTISTVLHARQGHTRTRGDR